MTFADEYANDAQTGAAPPKPEICTNRIFGWKKANICEKKADMLRSGCVHFGCVALRFSIQVES